MEETDGVPESVKFGLHNSPRLLADSAEEASKELFKQVQWSPDGSCLLASTQDNALGVYVLPPDILDPLDVGTEGSQELTPYTTVQECEPTKSSLWYPGMNLQSPETCCFLSSTADQPVHLWDCLTAKLRASYPLIDHRERYLSPFSMTFSNNAEDLICGTNSQVSVFSLENPGRPPTSISTSKLFSGTKGIISALAVSPDDILASGTFTNVISLFSRSYEHISTFKSSEIHGITQIIWSHDGKYMYIIPRQSRDIEVWDIRSTGEMVSILRGREAVTNQRLWADLSADGAWLVSGGTDGIVRGWKADCSNAIVEPSMKFKAHNDSVSSAVLHPSWPMLATCSGSYSFDIEDEDGDDVRESEYSMKVWVFE